MTELPRDPQDPDRRPESGQRIDRDTGRWTGIAALAFLSGALGVLVSRPGLLLVGVVGVAFAAAAAAARPPTVDLGVRRRLETDLADRGEAVRVTVTVTNEGDSLLPDLRLVDGVPPALEVCDGSPRLATALRPGKRVTFSYAVAAARGRHTFEPLTVLARGFAGAVERELLVDDASSTRLTCTPSLERGPTLPLRPQTTPFTGRVPTDAGGAGTEFFGVRAYRPGDPLSRIDWRRAARTGEFATLEFRQERAATVVLVVDARADAYLAPDADSPSAVERSVLAAGEAFTSLLASGDQVGLAAYGPAGGWLAPGTGETHRARARKLLATHEGFSPVPPADPFFASLRLRQLRRRLPADAQVVLFSPLCDDYVASVARRLDAYGHLVTVVSPDPTADDTAGHRLARVERGLRLSALRRARIRVVDWRPDEPLDGALARARTRWSR